MNRVPQSASRKLAYRSEIDGLRAFAVLSVVAFHTFPNLVKGGFIGVDVFFVISGFLITSQIFERLDKGQFTFASFLGRRIRRIFPALIIVMTSALAFGWFVLLADEYAQLGKHVASGAVFITNFILVNESGYFDNASETKPMLHLWSLAVEEQFYVIWPLVLWFAWKRKSNLLIITVVVAFISFYLNLRFSNSHPAEMFFWPVSRFWELLSGSVLAWFLMYKGAFLSRQKLSLDRYLVGFVSKKKMLADGATTSNAMSFFGLLLLAYGVIRINEGMAFPSAWTLMPILGALLIIGSGSKALLNRIFLMNPIAVWFGLISYPLYLWHWPILSFLQIVNGEFPERDTRIAAVLISVLLAWLTYRFFEMPIRLGRNQIRNSVLLVLALLLVGMMGFFVNKGDGQTWYNIAAKDISKASGDWGYPNGLVNQKRNGISFWATSSASPQVIIFGDSHSEQYGPRVVDHYKNGLSKEVAFVTDGGCPSIPNVYEDKHKECPTSNLKRLSLLLELSSVETVIFGAKLNGYFSDDPSLGKGYDYYYKESEFKRSLTNAEALSLAKASLFEFLYGLSETHKIVLLIDNPIDDRFNPSFILNNSLARRSIPFALNLNVGPFDRAKYQVDLAEELKKMFLRTDVDVADPASTICPNNICSPITSEGLPIYKDKDHMRPFYVRTHMMLLDKYLLE